MSLHTRGMTWQEASKLLHDELGFDARLADAEARRYCAYPTYQLCYAVGRREILQLRDDARRSRGTKFALSAFHDELLTYGSYPTALARWGMGTVGHESPRAIHMRRRSHAVAACSPSGEKGDDSTATARRMSPSLCSAADRICT